MRSIFKIKVLMLCMGMFFMLDEVQGKPYPSAANAWPAWKGVLEGKRVGLVIHRSSTIGGRLMPEVLLEEGVDVRMIFVPEHGLRVDFEAGATVGDHVDAVTGLPVVSLYGKRKGPEPTHTDSLDIIVFDLQDVGVRFYTYLSTLHYVMEACSRASITLLVLDRPNVNDYTVDGPVLDPSYKSFVGMHPIPVMHGMTMGELALMIKGEGWSKSASSLNLQVWKMQDYQRGLRLQPPIPPSPNLRDSMALEWYPTLCFLEGCPVSIGRGTVSPFTVMGSPWFSRTDTCFVPISIPGRSVKPLYMNQICCGISMHTLMNDQKRLTVNLQSGLRIELLQWAYRDYTRKRRSNSRFLASALRNWSKAIPQEANSSAALPKEFFDPFFDLLAGGPSLRVAMTKGHSAAKIRGSWKPELMKFRKLRSTYLLYPDLD
ncbi:MAG: DUF1343 domain-containing protein [Sphingobacteriia bacterium]|nr:DUF1343 domain-containing protein [Sphingobacteriia bacterium]